MDNEKKQDMQELSEEELAKVNGAIRRPYGAEYLTDDEVETIRTYTSEEKTTCPLCGHVASVSTYHEKLVKGTDLTYRVLYCTSCSRESNSW